MLEVLLQFTLKSIFDKLSNWFSSHKNRLLAHLQNSPYYADLLASTHLREVDPSSIRGTLEEHFKNIGLHFQLEGNGNNFLEYKLSKFIAPIIVKWSIDSVYLMQAEDECTEAGGILFEVQFTGYAIERYKEFQGRLKEMARFLAEMSSLIANKFDGENSQLVITINRTRYLSPFEGGSFAPQPPKTLAVRPFEGGVMLVDQCAIQLTVHSVETFMNFHLSPLIAELRPCK